MHIAFITAGGAGMFCGSCMHDNTWARALMAQGAEVTLIPTYTPVRVDEQNVADSEVFLGGINVYLEYRSRLWGKLPRALTRWLDAPWAINLATKFGVSNNASQLGALTLAMLDGELGPQRREIDELVSFLARQLKPDVVVFSNALLAGVVRRLRQEFAGKIYCVLQGDDIFLKDLPEPFQSRAIEKIGERAAAFDGFIVHSRYYRDFMSDYLRLPRDRFHLLPLGIDLAGHNGLPHEPSAGRFIVGYFARICPEKGLHRLIEAFRHLHRAHPEAKLLAGGYLGLRDEGYFRELQQSAADLGDAFVYAGSPATHAEKVELLQRFNLLSVPTEYHEPKGLYVLEALANGIPVVQPRHGAFPELIEATQGGLLVPPDDPQALAEGIAALMQDKQRRLELARTGQQRVRELYGETAMAKATLTLFSR